MMTDSQENQDAAVRVAALGAMYQADRTENVTLLNINIALLGAVLAYAAASVAFLDKIATLPRIAAALVPIPLWLGMLYSTLLVAVQGRRGASAMVVEKALFSYTGLSPLQVDEVGSRAGEYIVNPKLAPWPYKILMALVYLAPWALTFLYTWYMVQHYVVSGQVLYVAAAGYGLLLIVATAAYGRAFLDSPQVAPLTAQQPKPQAKYRSKDQRHGRGRRKF